MMLGVKGRNLIVCEPPSSTGNSMKNIKLLFKSNKSFKSKENLIH